MRAYDRKELRSEQMHGRSGIGWIDDVHDDDIEVVVAVLKVSLRVHRDELGARVIEWSVVPWIPWPFP